MASLLTLVRNNGSIDPRESTLRAKKEELLCVYAREDEDVAFPSFISLSLSLSFTLVYEAISFCLATWA